MEYLAFALKYRPKNFDEVVGQNHVVSALKTAISNQRVHHAYLFSGPRGVGKTSLARILAKSLNCQKGPTASPCCECPNCLSIAKGNSLDIIEIDGASNRGIDEIRTLRENVKLSAASSRYKIYIIDEVHMLTQEAFNALLKTLEEPPRHVKFIFATTHPHKVIPTILSRCQKFQFSLLSLEEIAKKLKTIVKLEKVKVPENLIYTIAKAAGGSIRDAESLLDQLVPVILEKGDLEDIFSFLGIIDESSLNKVLESIITKDLKEVLTFIDAMVTDGKDLGVFTTAFIEHLRNILLAKVSPKAFNELSDVSPESKNFISKLAASVSTADILKLIDSLIGAKTIASRLNTIRVPLELAFIKYAYDEKDLPPVVYTSDKKSQSSTLSKKSSTKKAKSYSEITITADDLGQPVKDSKESLKEEEKKKASLDSVINNMDLGEKEPEKVKEPEIETEDIDNLEVEADNILLTPFKAKWEEALKHIQRSRAAIGSHLSFAIPFVSKGDIVTIAFDPSDSFHKEMIEGTKKVRFIEDAFTNLLGKQVHIKLILQTLAQRPRQDLSNDSKDNNVSEEKIKSKLSGDNEFLNDLFDTFGGKFHSEEK